ncbi:MAG: RNA methyltransferase [Tepidisphaera sp.]|nr:RNA methyltransferase [Tepidisphaera sp.]
MDHWITITDPADPRVAEYADLPARAAVPRGLGELDGPFVAEGELVVEQLLASRFGVRSVLTTPARAARMGESLAGRTVYVAPQEVIERIVGYEFHRGVLACGERVAGVSASRVMREARTLVVLENVSNADNVGSLFRSVAALGGGGAGVLLSPGCCDPLYRKALRVSMGHALRVPFAPALPWPGVLAEARDQGFTILALTPAGDAMPLGAWARAHRGARVALLLGAEGPGLTGEAMGLATQRVRIPMTPGVDSLNIAVAGAVALSHVVEA